MSRLCDTTRGTQTEPDFPEGYPAFAAKQVESLREWIIDNEFVPDADFRCSKRQAMALLDWCDGLFREARAE